MDNYTGLVLFYSDNCGYCHQVRPLMDNLSHLYTVKQVDCTRDPNNKALLKVYNVVKFPTIYAMKGGQPVAEFKGSRTMESIQDFANRHLGSSEPPLGISGESENPTLAGNSLSGWSILIYVAIAVVILAIIGLIIFLIRINKVRKISSSAVPSKTFGKKISRRNRK